jgi:cytochrome c oxidase assembly protein subunit 15
MNQQTQTPVQIDEASTFNRRLHWFSIALMATTFVLLMSGGTVTSKGVGMAVPDWPTTFNENMFLAHPRLWFGPGRWPQFWEHSHRLLGSLVGFLAILQMLWLWRTQKARPWLKYLGVFGLVLVCVQGLMGGFRVTENSDFLAAVHGVNGQLYFCITILCAAATGPVWAKAVRLGTWVSTPRNRGLIIGAWVLLFALLIQLVLGAMVRHSKSGLAIYDFPTSYGQVLPPMDQASLDKLSADLPFNHQTSGGYLIWQVHLHFAHRAFAVVVSLILAWVFVQAYRRASETAEVSRPAGVMAGLLLLQIALGASVIWSARQTEITTLHQSVGALLLGVTFLLTLRVHLFQNQLKLVDPEPVEQQDQAQQEKRTESLPDAGVQAGK